MTSDNYLLAESLLRTSGASRHVDPELYRRLITAIEQVADVIVITDTAGLIQYVNPAFQKVTGYSFEEVVGQTPRVLRSHHHPESFYKAMWQTILSGETWKGTVINRHKSGNLLEEEMTISPLRDSQNRIVNYVAVKRDVSQQRAMEKQLRQAQKLESIGQLAAGIAHEINTPIQYVGDNIRFLQTAFDDMLGLVTSLKTRVGELPDELRDQLCHWLEELAAEADLDYLTEEVPSAIDQSLEGVERVATIVRAMKEFSHPGGDEKVMLDLNSAISNTITVARNEWKYVADLVTDFDPDLPQVPCMAGELNQVWLNLIVNAAHAIGERRNREGMERKGSIEIRTRHDGEWVEVSLADTGGGIPVEIREKIFDPFFTTKEVGKGTGQGLSIAHSVIVEKHKGTIAFSSEPGVGTVFTVRLPLSDDPESGNKG